VRCCIGSSGQIFFNANIHVFVNDGISVSTWQDGTVADHTADDAGSPSSGPDPAPGLRTIEDVPTLKALADPLRIAILTTLMRGVPGARRVMSVKELAAELGEPQTKLYRHVKQLERAGLIRVAASRMVSGILEQRYQACQTDLRFGRELLRDTAAADDATAVIAALFDQFRDRFLAALRDGAISMAEFPAERSHRRAVLYLDQAGRVPAARAVAVRDRLLEVISELEQPAGDTEDSVPVEVLISFFSPPGAGPG
jgi:DNA-binding transcriptional ArsR family regulator